MKKTIFLIIVTLVFTLSSFSQSVGDKVEVDWNGSWYKATILEAKSNSWLISYEGYGSEWNEWVGADRIKFPWFVGQNVLVEWKGEWFPAQILEIKNGQYKIHYDGYGSEWDEWVGINRMKKR